MKRLLELIGKNASFGILGEHNFDMFTKEQVEFFYRFLGNGKDNIPQSDNNIVSDFLGYLYLMFGDLIIEDCINKIEEDLATIAEYKIIRYVDDIYIMLKFSDDKKGERFIYRLLNKVADEFYQKLNLRINRKVEVFRLYLDGEKEKLLNKIKQVSPEYPEPDQDQESLTIPERVDKLLKQIETINDGDISKIYEKQGEKFVEALKDIFDPGVYNLLLSSIHKDKLQEILEKFEFPMIRLYPQPLVILLSLLPEVKNRLEKYLRSIPDITIFDRAIIIEFLCQSGFENDDLIEKLHEDRQLKPIMEFIEQQTESGGQGACYPDVSFEQIKSLISQVSLVEQIRLRVYHERQGQYSIALNHLLNEIHLICCILGNGDIRKYKVLDVKTFLNSKCLDNETVRQIERLFDRRHNNPVSHPGSDSRVAWAVGEGEYLGFKKYVSIAVNKITRKTESEGDF